MKRNANKRKTAVHQSVSDWLLRSGTAIVAQNPVVVGGSTAFLLTLFFVSANALWYQPHGHPSALFPTRAQQFQAPEPGNQLLPESISGELETTIRIEREEIAQVPADPVVHKVQSVLSDLNLYTGSVDGIAGPKTKDAVRNYRRIIGLEESDEIDENLLDQLGAKPSDNTASITPLPVARPSESRDLDSNTAKEPTVRGSIAVRIQAGLRAFGNDHIEIDGIIGPQTSEAIREFQTLFGLEANGKADETVLTKMRDLGLTS